MAGITPIGLNGLSERISEITAAHDTGVSVHQAGFYIMGVPDDPAFVRSQKNVFSGVGPDDRIFMSDGASNAVNLKPNKQSVSHADDLDRTNFLGASGNPIAKQTAINEVLSEHLNTLGEDDVFILDHGGAPAYLQGKGLFGPENSAILYDDLFGKMPSGVNAVYVDNCFSGSALASTDKLPEGTMLFTAVSSETPSYEQHSRDVIYSKQNQDKDLDAIDAFKSHLIESDYTDFALRNGLDAPNDVSRIVPTQFGISGYGIVDLKEHAHNMTPDQITAAAESLKENLAGLVKPESMAKVDAARDAMLSGKHPPDTLIAPQHAITTQHLQDSGQLDQMITQAKASQIPVFNISPEKTQTAEPHIPVFNLSTEALESVRQCGTTICGDEPQDAVDGGIPGEQASQAIGAKSTNPAQEHGI